MFVSHTCQFEQLTHIPFSLAHYQDVILTIFKYINLLKKDGVQSRIFEEVQSLASLAFRFKEKYPPSQYTSRLAGLMQHGYPDAYILSGPSLIRNYDAQLIKDNLDWIRPDNFRIMLASQTPPNGIEYTEKETWYGTEYNVVDFDAGLIEVKYACCCRVHPSLIHFLYT